jgi:hypothetical protein
MEAGNVHHLIAQTASLIQKITGQIGVELNNFFCCWIIFSCGFFDLKSKNLLFWIVTDLRESLAIIFERFVTPYS